MGPTRLLSVISVSDFKDFTFLVIESKTSETDERLPSWKGQSRSPGTGVARKVLCWCRGQPVPLPPPSQPVCSSTSDLQEAVKLLSAHHGGLVCFL